MADQNHSIIFISHKMKEVLDLSNRITILHRGKSMGTYLNKELSAEILSNLMLGKKRNTITSGSSNEFSKDIIRKKLPKEETEIIHRTKKEIVSLTDIHAHNNRGNKILNGIKKRIKY